MAILINGATTISINEATPGVEIGTLSGGIGTYELYYSQDTYSEVFETSSDNPTQIIGNTLSLDNDWYLDFETKKFTKFNFSHQNGYISGTVTTSNRYFDNEGDNPTVRIKSGSEDQIFTISIVDKDEAVAVTTPTPFTQNRYGAVIGQVLPNDNFFSTVYFQGASFLEIAGSDLKLTDNYYYSENGWILDNEGNGFNTQNSSQFTDLKFIVPSGYTSDSTDHNNDGNGDFGYTTLPVNTYLTSLFGSSNINTSPEITLTAIPFTERQFGSTLASINFSGAENITYTISHSFLELTQDLKIKLKDDYYYNKTTGWVVNENGGGYPVVNSNELQIIALDSSTGSNLITETISIPELTSTIFSNSNVSGTALITVTPVSFFDKELGSIIAKLEYTGTETADFTLKSEGGGEHSFLEMSGANHVKLKDTYYYDDNRGVVTKQDFSGTYKLADQGITFNKLNILAKDSSSQKNLASELITFQDFSSVVFSDSNIEDKDQSYTFVTDLNWVDRYENYPKTGREEHQKDIGKYWVLKTGEKISYSFLEPGANYYDNYQELDGLISPSEAFKNAGRQAFDLISSYTNITFDEITETGNIVGDFRMGIVDKDHFGLPLSYSAYSQSVSHLPTGGNIFFNGTQDQNVDGICDFNQESQLGTNSYNFVTFMHEILHSLGLKHPFDVFDATDQEEGNANVVSDQYEQYSHTIMSYTPIRNKDPFDIKYDGITLNSSQSTKQYYPATPMLFDIMAIQEMYGVNNSNASQDNIYNYNPENPPFEAIYDTGGNDILDLSTLSGGSQLRLEGNELSKIGASYLIPFKSEDGSGTTYGTAQGSSLAIIAGTEIEKVLLPEGESTVSTGTYSTYIVGKNDSLINIEMNASELAIKAFGSSDDVLTLKQTDTNWKAGFIAKHVGNNGQGAIGTEVKLTNYLKHDLSVDLSQGTDTIQGTVGNDALFLQNFGTTGNSLFYEENNNITSSTRILGIENINLLDGDNLIDLTSTTRSLADQDISITTGSGNDILWLSDANETINAGHGDDQIVVNGGTDTLVTGQGNDIVTITNTVGNLTLSDFDPTTDKFIFHTNANNVAVDGNTIKLTSNLGDYDLILTNNPDLSTLSDFTSYT